MAFGGLLDNVATAIRDAEEVIYGFGEDCGRLIHEYRQAIKDWQEEDAYNTDNPTDQVDSGFLDDLFEELSSLFEDAQNSIDNYIEEYGVERYEVDRELDYAGKEAFEDVHLGDVYDQWANNR